MFEGGAQTRDNGWWLRRGDVEFEIARHLNAVGRRADFGQSPPVLFRLGEENANALQNLSQPSPESAIAAERTIRNAGVHHCDSRTTLRDQVQEIRPELGLSDNDQRGLQLFQVRADGKREVERKIENVFGAEQLFGELLAGRGCG